jgi:hypothetical protein
VLERDLEAACLRLATAAGGRMPKWVRPGNRGVPDRILILPGRGASFLEFKRDDHEELTDKQARWLAFLDACGARAGVIRSVQDFRVHAGL